MAASSSSVTSFEIDGSPAPLPRAAIPPPPPPPHYHSIDIPAPPPHYHSIDIPAPPPFESAIPPPPPPPQPMHAPQPLETAIPPPPPPPAPPAPENPVGGRPATRGWLRFLEENDRFMEKEAPSLMVVATLVLGYTVQAGINPPGGVVTDTPRNKSKSVLAVVNRGAYDQYFAVLTVAMVVSVSGIACLVSGIPINRRIFVLLLRLITWVSLMAVVILYAISVTALTPVDIHGPDKTILRLRYSLLALAGLMGLILVAHIIRLIADCRRRGADGEAAAA